MRRVCEIIMALDFIFRLVLDCPVNCLFSIICQDVVKKYRLETSFKGDSVKALIKTSNKDHFDRYFSKKVQQIAAFAVLSCFSVTKQSLENAARMWVWLKSICSRMYGGHLERKGSFKDSQWKCKYLAMASNSYVHRNLYRNIELYMFFRH